MKIDIKALAVISVIIGLLAFFWLTPSSGLQAAPEPQFTTLKGDVIAAENLKDKPYMVVFWATDCATCVREIPHLTELYAELQPEGFEIIGVAMPHDDKVLIEAMRDKRNMNYPLVHDEEGLIAQAYGGVKVTPTSFLVTPNNRIAMRQLGQIDMDDLRQRIRSYL